MERSHATDRRVRLSPPPPFLFVVGCRRSGTTLLGTIFDSHSRMAMAHEARFVASSALRENRFAGRGGFDPSRLVDDLNGQRGFQRLGLDRKEVHGLLVSPPAADYPEAVRRIFAAYAHGQGKLRYGDKMPGYVVHIALLAQLFPEARFIHIIRDGRDVALSLTDLWFAERGVGAAALFWKRRVVQGRAAGRRLGHERYREIRYEDLIDDPGPALRGLCEFADLGFEPSMLEFFQRGDEVVARTGDPALHQRLLLPPTRGLRDWRSQMDRDDVLLFEALAGTTLTALGYERASVKSSARSRQRAGTAWLAWQRQRVLARMPGAKSPLSIS